MTESTKYLGWCLWVILNLSDSESVQNYVCLLIKVLKLVHFQGYLDSAKLGVVKLPTIQNLNLAFFQKVRFVNVKRVEYLALF